jgi:hypothetical protein
MFILWFAQLHNNTLINFSVCSVQSWRRAETPKWDLDYFSQTKSSRRRNIDIKTERQRVSRDLAVRRVVLPGWVKSLVRAMPSSTETSERHPEIHEGLPNLAESNNSWRSREFCKYGQPTTWLRVYFQWVGKINNAIWQQICHFR